MELAAFLAALFKTGRVRVPPPVAAHDDLAEAERLLHAQERVRRAEWPGTPPPWRLPAALWAAAALYRACQLSVCRELGPSAVAAAAAEPFPGPRDAAAHYSVDLTFRYLPDLLRLARHAAEGDPLVAVLRSWAAEWPLSSVGVQDLEPPPPGAAAEHPALLAEYADRVTRKGDLTRLADPRVRAAVAAVLGAHPELNPSLAAALASTREACPAPTPSLP